MRPFEKVSMTSPSKHIANSSGIACIQMSHRGPAMIAMSDGSVDRAACLNCPDTPCVTFTDAELKCEMLRDFPFNRDPSVCPFEALAAEPMHSIPVIDMARCNGCGLCIARCPVKALHADDDGLPALNNEENALFRYRPTRNDAALLAEREGARAAPIKGELRSAQRQQLEALMASVHQRSSSHNLLVRNLLLCLGARAAVRTIGDTNVRMDLWSELDGLLYLVEVDFDVNSLIDSPRSVLDDYAVCVARHGIPPQEVRGAIVCLEFPNRRSDYYDLISDIQNVLDVRITTLSVASLLLLLWHSRRLSRDMLEEGFLAKLHTEGIAEDMAQQGLSPWTRQLLRTRFFRAIK